MKSFFRGFAYISGIGEAILKFWDYFMCIFGRKEIQIENGERQGKTPWNALILKLSYIYDIYVYVCDYVYTDTQVYTYV